MGLFSEEYTLIFICAAGWCFDNSGVTLWKCKCLIYAHFCFHTLCATFAGGPWGFFLYLHGFPDQSLDHRTLEQLKRQWCRCLILKWIVYSYLFQGTYHVNGWNGSSSILRNLRMLDILPCIFPVGTTIPQWRTAFCLHHSQPWMIQVWYAWHSF